MAIRATMVDQTSARRRFVNRRRLITYIGRTWPLYAMLTPALVILTLFSYYPMYGVIIAFQDYNPGLGFTGSPWVGFENFRFLFSLPDFRQVLWNTILISVAKLVTEQMLAVTLALMLNEIRSMYLKRWVQSLVYLPHFLSWIMLGGILIDILSARGIVNQTLGLFDIGPIIFLGSNTWFRPTIVFTYLWKEVGWDTIIFLAALAGIDPSLHEAAAIDGANRWQRMLTVVLPGIAPTVVLVSALSLGGLLSAGFDQILTLYNPVVYQTGDILDTYVYRTGLVSAQFSLAGAVGLFQSIIGFVLIAVAWLLARRYSGYTIF